FPNRISSPARFFIAAEDLFCDLAEARLDLKQLQRGSTVKIRLLFALLAALFIGAMPAAHSRQQASAIAITHANVIDGVSNQPLRDATVFIRDGKIEDVVPGPAHMVADQTVIDLKGHWLLPGFEDAHAHLATLAAARLALLSGVTTARCLGVNHF